MASFSVLTTSNGNPIENNQSSITVGSTGPLLLQDFHLIDKLSHFDRERIPERVVHAKGAGAHGYFEVTAPHLDRLTKAKFLDKVGKRTPILIRFSTVGGEKGSADTERDPRGFAVKFYTEEGNWDMTGNNTPIFFVRDPIKFPDFIHTQKRHPQTNLKDADMVWDFFSLSPETLHQATVLFSERGIPDGYRFMHGFSSHALKFVNAAGEGHFVKLHFICDQGVKNMPTAKATVLAGQDPDYATRDLFAAIERGEFPSWTVKLQVIPEGQMPSLPFNPFDVTKVWPHAQFPVQEIGRMTLDRNPQNYFAEIEQAAFSPSHMVPGIEPSYDRMLQGRLFSYPDTHRHRLGANYKQIPVNRPLRCPVSNYQRDGPMVVNGNFGSIPNYEPNSHTNGPKQTSQMATIPWGPEIRGIPGRFDQRVTEVDFHQPAKLYNQVLGSDGQRILIENMGKALSGAKPHIRRRQIDVIKRADRQWASRVEQEMYKTNGSRL